MKYQVMRDLTQDEYVQLKESIIENGVLVPVEFDEFGNIIDGHHRKKICDELGITDYPINIREGLSDNEKIEMARQLNEARRHLTPEEKSREIKRRLHETPELSDRQIAKQVGVSNKTVSVTRKELEEEGQLCKLHSSIGADGKERPRQVERKSEQTEPQNDSKPLFVKLTGCSHEHVGCNKHWCELCKSYKHCCADCAEQCNASCGWVNKEPEEHFITDEYGKKHPISKEQLNAMNEFTKQEFKKIDDEYKIARNISDGISKALLMRVSEENLKIFLDIELDTKSIDGILSDIEIARNKLNIVNDYVLNGQKIRRVK